MWLWAGVGMQTTWGLWSAEILQAISLNPPPPLFSCFFLFFFLPFLSLFAPLHAQKKFWYLYKAMLKFLLQLFLFVCERESNLEPHSTASITLSGELLILATFSSVVFFLLEYSTWGFYCEINVLKPYFIRVNLKAFLNRVLWTLELLYIFMVIKFKIYKIIRKIN